MINIQTGVDVYPIPVPSTQENIQPILQFKEVPIYTKKIVQKEDRKRKRPSPLKKPEIEILKKVFKRANDAVETIVEHGLTSAMTEFNS